MNTQVYVTPLAGHHLSRLKSNIGGMMEFSDATPDGVLADHSPFSPLPLSLHMDLNSMGQCPL
jgi:hypothetical protein